MSSSTTRCCGSAGRLLFLLTLLAACSTTPPRSSAHGRPPLVVLSVESVCAPIRGLPEDELRDLDGVPGHAAQLRRSWVQLSAGRPQAALDAAALVLYGAARPSPNEEAFARYLRAEAFRRLDRHDHAAYDTERGVALATDPELARRLRAMQPAGRATGAAPSGALALDVHPRSSWGAKPVIASRLDPMGRIYRMTVHHSAIYFRGGSAQATATALRNYQFDMMGRRQWGDIGYHFLIDPDGRIWEGRELRYQGAHAEGDNNVGNVGICVLGNFMRGAEGQRPTPRQIHALRNLVGTLAQRYGIDADQLFKHDDFKVTACPGPLLEGPFAQIKRELKQKGAGALAMAVADDE